jgi:hypothetical protein
MTHLEVLFLCVPFCAIFAKLVCVLETAWNEEARRTAQRVLGPESPDRIWIEPDHRPQSLYKPLAPVDVVSLPWKDGRW